MTEWSNDVTTTKDPEQALADLREALAAPCVRFETSIVFGAGIESTEAIIIYTKTFEPRARWKKYPLAMIPASGQDISDMLLMLGKIRVEGREA